VTIYRQEGQEAECSRRGMAARALHLRRPCELGRRLPVDPPAANNRLPPSTCRSTTDLAKRWSAIAVADLGFLEGAGETLKIRQELREVWADGKMLCICELGRGHN